MRGARALSAVAQTIDSAHRGNADSSAIARHIEPAAAMGVGAVGSTAALRLSSAASSALPWTGRAPPKKTSIASSATEHQIMASHSFLCEPAR